MLQEAFGSNLNGLTLEKSCSERDPRKETFGKTSAVECGKGWLAWIWNDASQAVRHLSVLEEGLYERRPCSQAAWGW